MTKRRRRGDPRQKEMEASAAPAAEEYRSPLVPLLWVIGPLVLLAIYGACS